MKLVYSRPKCLKKEYRIIPCINKYLDYLADCHGMSKDRILNTILFNAFRLQKAQIDFDEISSYMQSDELD